MKRFLIKIIVMSLVLLSSILVVFLQADDKSDPFYLKFTSSKQQSLILGSSRAAIGLQPSIFKDEADIENLYNYAFTYNTSPYGPTYLNSIKEKLKKAHKQGTFILAVDPWIISSDGPNPNSLDGFTESAQFLGTVDNVNTDPNFGYLLNGYSDLYIKLLFNFSPYTVHDDGWLEVKLNLTEKEKHTNLKKSVENYNHKKTLYKFSKKRLDYLEKTIVYLKNYGSVYVTSLPIHKEMQNIETNLMPNFENRILELTEKLQIPYFNLSEFNSDMDFTDGHHLTTESSIIISKILSEKIKSYENFKSNNLNNDNN